MFLCKEQCTTGKLWNGPWTMVQGPALTLKGNMKQFRIDVSRASPGQILTIAAELKIMSNNWEKFGPRIWINGHKLQAPELREPRHKRATNKRHNYRV